MCMFRFDDRASVVSERTSSSGYSPAMPGCRLGLLLLVASLLLLLLLYRPGAALTRLHALLVQPNVKVS